MKRHTADELLQAYARGERMFSYWSLSSADLHGADLREANFFGSDLRWANLNGADLSGANLGNADLHGASLSGANLSGAFLGDAFYKDANLTGANMIGVMTANTFPALAANQPTGVSGGGYALSARRSNGRERHAVLHTLWRGTARWRQILLAVRTSPDRCRCIISHCVTCLQANSTI